MDNPDDGEWEYEYDQDETEDFYIPLDLTNVPGAQTPMVSQGRPGHPTLLKTRLRALNAARGQPMEFSTDTSGQETATMGEVQIIGLHTTNPLVMYNGQLLSCHWTSTIGTDMFFVKPDSSAGDSVQPLRSLPSVDLLSLGSAKLVAKVGRLRPRDDLFDGANAAQRAAESTAVSNENQAVDAVSSQGVSTEGQPASEQMQPPQTSFLARLNQAKVKRGDTSRLTISRTPDGSRLIVDAIQGNATSAAPQGDMAMGGT